MLIGFDIGGTKTEIGLFSPDYQPVERWRIPTPQDSYEALIAMVEGELARAVAKSEQVTAIGFGLPGILDADGRAFSANIQKAKGRPIARDLRNLCPYRVAIGNDCRLFALSEAHGGAGEGMGTVFGLILGTGAAGGLVIHGQLYHGDRGLAGECGHWPISADMIEKHGLSIRTCGCGLVGCAEQYISGPGFLRTHKEIGGTATSPSDIFEFYRHMDPVAVTTVDIFFDLLGGLLALITMAYDPAVIVLGGGLSLVPEVERALPNAIERHLFGDFAAPQVRKAKYGDASGARGAALLADMTGTG